MSAKPWQIVDGIVNPFGDRRQAARNVFTFDLDAGMLLYSEATENLQISLSQAREKFLDWEQFIPFTPATVPALEISNIPGPSWNPQLPDTPRRFTFVERLLSDFNHAWRHILRHPYRDSTLRKSARAIIQLSSLDFTVFELTERMHLYATGWGPFIDVHSLLPWAGYDQKILDLGRTKVILDQNIELAIRIMREDVAQLQDEKIPSENTIYVLLSVRHVMLCRVSPKNTSFTRPESLCNGVGKPSHAAVKMLLHALSYPRRPPPRTLVHKLPIEIQDRILYYVSDGPIESARLGCTLSLGSTFNWQRRKDRPRKQGAIEVLPCHIMRYEGSPVESKIFFGGIFSGLDYR